MKRVDPAPYKYEFPGDYWLAVGQVNYIQFWRSFCWSTTNLNYQWIATNLNPPLPRLVSPRSQIDREDNDRLRSEVDELVKQLIDQLTGLENHLLLGAAVGPVGLEDVGPKNVRTVGTWEFTESMLVCIICVVKFMVSRDVTRLRGVFLF